MIDYSQIASNALRSDGVPEEIENETTKRYRSLPPAANVSGVDVCPQCLSHKIDAFPLPENERAKHCWECGAVFQ